MADDGMLLNLAPDLKWEAKPVFKGGHWKDRLTAKKAALYGAQKRRERNEAGTSQDASAMTGSGETATERPAKRAKVDRAGNQNHVQSSQSFKPSTQRKSANGHSQYAEQIGGRGEKEVISSLFTYNPEPKPKEEAEAAGAGEEEDAEASNAPLSPEMANFTNLGLSRSVAKHLLEKMSIKAPTSIQRQAISRLLREDSDAFLQAETGSGKTLAYLLPLVQRLLELSQKLKESHGQRMNRLSGLFAVILAPTRELARQIVSVLEVLLGCAHWIVAGMVTGGEKKKSEKARLRKGVNILVATPGRLADHLNNTEVLDVSKVRWLVLDEGDRLMELGFEQDIQKIVSTFNLRMRAQRQDDVAPLLPSKRTTVLCSATLRMNVQRLGEISLKNAAHIVSEEKGKTSESSNAGEVEKAFRAPSQLKQSFVVVPAKQRLVTLVAVLRRAFARKGSTMKAIVFLSCADSVDFHFSLLSRSANDDDDPPHEIDRDASSELPASKQQRSRTASIPQGQLLPQTLTSSPSPILSSSTDDKNNPPPQLFRLHGSLPQAVRTSTLRSFAQTTEPAVMVCTDVASRGLDLPSIDLVVEYDPAFSFAEHLHRVGRTARAGRDGRAVVFLLPGSEEGYVELLREGQGLGAAAGKKVTGQTAEEVMAKGFVGPQGGWEERATEWQLDAETWVLGEERTAEVARRAFQSHVRAYATHTAKERGYFDIKALHLGHLAKAFALRERPGGMKVPGKRKGKEEVRADRKQAGAGRQGKTGDGDAVGGGGGGGGEETDGQEARRRMRAKMKMLEGAGAGEFNIG